MGGHRLPLESYRCLRASEANELCGNHSTLVHQLVEAVLAVGSRLSEDYRSRLGSQSGALQTNCLPVALHVELLNVCGEPEQGLTVWEHRPRCVAAHVVVIEAHQSQKHREVLREVLGVAEVLVH